MSLVNVYNPYSSLSGLLQTGSSSFPNIPLHPLLYDLTLKSQLEAQLLRWQGVASADAFRVRDYDEQQRGESPWTQRPPIFWLLCIVLWNYVHCEKQLSHSHSAFSLLKYKCLHPELQGCDWSMEYCCSPCSYRLSLQLSTWHALKSHSDLLLIYCVLSALLTTMMLFLGKIQISVSYCRT